MYFKDKTYYINKVKGYLGLLSTAAILDTVIILCLFI